MFDKISEGEIRKLVQEILEDVVEEETTYQLYFKNSMNKLGIQSLNDLTETGVRKFMDFVGDHWDNEDDVSRRFSSSEIAADFEASDFKGEAPTKVKVNEAATRFKNAIIKEKAKLQ
mgnify:CR=1 FL=1